MIALRCLAFYGCLTAFLVDARQSQGYDGIATNTHPAKLNHPKSDPNIPGKLICRCKGHDKEEGKNAACGYHLGTWPEAKRPWCRAMYHCGTDNPKGSWFYCDKESIERRRGDDGKLKTAKEFQTEYGNGRKGMDKWKKAANWVERRLAQDAGSGWYGNVLYPIHHESAKAYTSSEFRKHYQDAYGELYWVEKWKASMEEERQAPDGEFYTFNEYEAHYGAEQAWKEWDDHGHHIGHKPRTETYHAHMSPTEIMKDENEDEEEEEIAAQLAREDAEDSEDL